MPNEKEYQGTYERMAALRETMASRLANDLIENPLLAETIIQQVDDLIKGWEAKQSSIPSPPDRGLAELIGLGPDAAREIGNAKIPLGVEPYDEQVTSERIIAVGDLYYIYQHEKIGIFKAIRKLQELFRAGTVRLSAGAGAFALYQFDRRQVLRYTAQDRLAAYKRVLGYGTAAIPVNGRSNPEFHHLFSHFVNQVTLFWRDKRISDVIRNRAQDPSFGSIAVVRRAGLDLRNNLKWSSYGHLNVLRVEVMQLLDEAYKVLGSEDVKRLFGADNAWDVVEEILTRYFKERLSTSPRQRMAVAGRQIIRWLAGPHILQSTRAQFEALLADVADEAEEWLTSAQSLGAAERKVGERVVPWYKPEERAGRTA